MSTRRATAIEDAELRAEQPVDVRLVGHPEDVQIVYAALSRMVATAGLTPLRPRRAPDSRYTGNTTVIAAPGPSMTREATSGRLIERPAYAAFITEMAEGEGDRTVEITAKRLHLTAGLLGELAARLGHCDPVGRLAADTASRLWTALGI